LKRALTPEAATHSLHDALPICTRRGSRRSASNSAASGAPASVSTAHTSSVAAAVCSGITRPRAGQARPAPRSGATRAAAIDALSELPPPVAGDTRDVVLGAVNEAGLAPAQERQPERVQPGRVHHAAVVAQASLAVEHRHVQPRVVRAEAGGPEHGADLAAPEVQTEQRRAGDGGRRE